MNDVNRKKKTTDELLLWGITERLKSQPESPHSKRVERILDGLVELRESVGTVSALMVMRSGLLDGVSRYHWKNQVAITASDVRVARQPVPKNMSKDDFWEYGAVGILLDLVQKPDGLSRIGRCGVCRAWIFAAKRKGKKWCSDACKQRNNDRDPEKRENKKAYMKLRYENAKDREERAKKLIGFPEKTRLRPEKVTRESDVRK